MTAPSRTPVVTDPTTTPDTDAAAVGDLKRVITQHLAHTIAGMDRIAGHFVLIKTDVEDAGTITATLTRRRFAGDDCATRITLTLTDPIVIEPADLPQDISPRTTALLELWATGDAT